MDSKLKAQVHDMIRFKNRNGTTPNLDVGIVKAIRIQIGVVKDSDTIARTVEYLIERPPQGQSSHQVRRNWVMEEFIIENLSRT
jgi:hypothetical protein